MGMIWPVSSDKWKAPLVSDKTPPVTGLLKSKVTGFFKKVFIRGWQLKIIDSHVIKYQII